MGRHTGKKKAQQEIVARRAQNEIDAEYLRRYKESEDSTEPTDLLLWVRRDKIKKHLKTAERLEKRRKELEHGHLKTAERLEKRRKELEHG